jgi:pimeloyl-ACP methyl ester carboxylesterase
LVELWIVTVGFGIGTTVTLAFQLTWPWLEAGQTRTARARAVHLGDYVPTSLRVGAWAGAAVCLIAVPLLPLIMRPSPRLVALALLLSGVAVSLVVAEWTGRTVTRRPQPAADDAELYAQDAWRAGIAQVGYRNLALWAGMALIQVNDEQSLRPEISHSLTFVAMALLATSILTMVLAYNPADRFRARLWPRLRPGEFVGQHTGVAA